MGIQTSLEGQAKDLGDGFTVRRLLPSARRQAIGPFVFFDHFGPVDVEPASRHDVRPHPHIGLATVTYLFDGAIMHRDSLGVVQRIEPGAINWMTAGRGIVHSERRPEDLATQRYVNHGIQLWAALPREFEETEPSFTHTPAAEVPVLRRPGVEVRVLIGEAFGLKSPVKTFSKMLYLDVRLEAGAQIELAELVEEVGVYPLDGDVSIDGEVLPARTLALLANGGGTIRSESSVRLMVIGGDAVERRFMWWNFVSSSKARIEQAASEWEADTMGQIPGETERIPLPVRPVRSGDDAPL
ncbi:MAG: pirin family protein [Pseudomonadota bacterium]